MNFEAYLLEQIKKHPASMPQDLVKLCYQAAFGAEHLLTDACGAKEYFEAEYAAVTAADIPLYEPISDTVCRVNLAAWKCRALPMQWLFRMFAASAGKKNNSPGLFSDYLQTAEQVLRKAPVCFEAADWQTYVTKYRQAGMPAVHHSAQYRERENPSYRIVDKQLIRLLPILEEAAKKMQKDRACVIALDGRAASGKSTMAKQLSAILEADIIHMDDFFLPAALRTKERLDTPGGNIHHERFRAEVLPHISLPQSFSYRLFDCSTMDYGGERVIKNTQLRIVEGSYSCHPLFGKYADVTAFSDVTPAEQMRRIRRRDGEAMAETFRSKWIPLEEQYFKHYAVSQNADIRL